MLNKFLHFFGMKKGWYLCCVSTTQFWSWMSLLQQQLHIWMGEEEERGECDDNWEFHSSVQLERWLESFIFRFSHSSIPFLGHRPRFSLQNKSIKNVENTRFITALQSSILNYIISVLVVHRRNLPCPTHFFFFKAIRERKTHFCHPLGKDYQNCT